MAKLIGKEPEENTDNDATEST